MKILHYSLGFPPYRTGGLTKYCIDLMMTQKDMGHDVSMMWPGKFRLSGHFVRIKNKVLKSGIDSFEVVNPLPVPLDEGIEECGEFMRECPNPQVFVKFLKEYQPDVIHVHTLMGLYKEFLEEAKKLGIRIVFTSHDYFGICPKVTLFRDGKVCDGKCKNCAICNEDALSMTKIKILQSSLYRNLKDSALVKALRKRHRQDFFEEDKVVFYEEEHENIENTNKSLNYRKLREFYMEILKRVDIIHFNSSVAEETYRKFIPKTIKGKIINITHSNISDNRKKKQFEGKLKIAYLASAKSFKGYSIMKQALDELWNEDIRDFELDLYNQTPDVSEYMKIHDRFEYGELESIFDRTDMLIAPSVWHETFGFTVLEALSFGVPVMVSTNVGCKDLLENGRYGMLIEPTKDDVKRAVKYIIDNRENLREYNKRIVENMVLDKVMKSAEKIEKLYRSV